MDLLLWAHNLDEPEPHQLQQLQITALSLQVCIVRTGHDGGTDLSSYTDVPITGTRSIWTVQPSSIAPRNSYKLAF